MIHWFDDECGIIVIMYDGWTKFSQNYIGLLTTFNKNVYRGRLVHWRKYRYPPLSWLLVHCWWQEKLTRRMMVIPKMVVPTRIKRWQLLVFKPRNIFLWAILCLWYQFKNWAVSETSDNCLVNYKVAKLLEIPHIPCHNHLVNSEI